MKLVVSDLDGTILDNEEKISVRTKAVFAAVKAAGVDFMFATGRNFNEIDFLETYLNYDGVVICSNGAVTYDLGQKKILDAHILSSEKVLEIVDVARSVFPDVFIGVQTLDGFFYEKGYIVSEHFFRKNFFEFAVSDLLNKELNVVKVMLKDPGYSSDQLMSGLFAKLSSKAAITHASPVEGIVEITCFGTNKVVALQEYVKKIDVLAEDVVAFGDMPNDVEMLRWAGKSYAMGGGHPAALAASNFETLTLQEDGVAVALESLLAGL